jgi:hypothetical protein
MFAFDPDFKFLIKYPYLDNKKSKQFLTIEKGTIWFFKVQDVFFHLKVWLLSLSNKIAINFLKKYIISNRNRIEVICYIMLSLITFIANWIDVFYERLK